MSAAEDELVNLDRTTARLLRPSKDVLVWFGVLLPYVVLAALRVRFDWFPVQDQAVLDMRVRDLLSGSDVPLVGAFSRFGWSHPGPIWFVLLAPFRAVFRNADGMLIGSILLFGAGPATTVVVVRRRWGDWTAFAATLGSLAAVMAAGSFAVLIPWNPHLAFAWFPLFLVLCASAAERRAADIAPAVFLGAALVQLHVAYGLLILVPLVVSILAILVRDRQHIGALLRRSVRRSRSLGWIIGAVVIWIPPLIEQARNGADGNLRRLMGFFASPPDDIGAPMGWGAAVRVLGGVLRVPLVGLGGSGEATDPFTGFLVPGSKWTILILVGLVTSAAVAAAVRRDGAKIRVLTVVIAATSAGVVALSRVIGDLFAYLFVWRYALVWFAAVACIVMLLDSVVPSSRRPGTGRFAVVALAAAVVVLGVATMAASLGQRTDQILPRERATRELTARLERRGRPSGEVEILRFDGVLEGVADGILNRLDERGWPMTVRPDLTFKYGASRGASAAPSHVWFVTETNIGTTLASAVPGAEVVASVTPLSGADDAELSKLQLQVVEALQAQGRLDLLPALGSDLVAIALTRAGVKVPGVDLDRLVELNAKASKAGACRCAVIAVPPGTSDDVPTLIRSLALSAHSP